MFVFDSYFTAESRRTTTTSTSSLQGSWKLNFTTPSWSPLRYEVTVGTIVAPGDGVYNLKRDMVWKDVGLMTSAVITLPAVKRLVTRTTYHVYVRVWYNGSTYAVFRSPGVTLDITPPAMFAPLALSTKIQILPEHSNVTTHDVVRLNVSWEGSFSDPQAGIDHFIYGVGTIRGGKQKPFLFNNPIYVCILSLRRRHRTIYISFIRCLYDK